MPQYDWAKMSARERDELVVEQIIGWPLWNGMKGFYYTGLNTVPTPAPHYTTDISAAWEVVEKMKTTDLGSRTWGEQKPYQYVRTTITHSKNGVKVCVQTDGFSFKAESDSVADAISLGCLRAKGVDV